MPVPVQGGYQRGPSCWDRVKMGFTIGFCVGMASGALFGGFSALRYGLRGARADPECWQSDATGRWHIWNIHVHRNCNQMLKVYSRVHTRRFTDLRRDA
ncbi:hypothetical protein MTO96_002501 [Rhipicephalus appendiculatus]